MKYWVLLFAILLPILVIPSAYAESPEKDPPVRDRLKSSYTTFTAPVLKSYRVDLEGSKYRAYAVKWRGHEVVVIDERGQSDFNVGDAITVLNYRPGRQIKNGRRDSLKFLFFSANNR